MNKKKNTSDNDKIMEYYQKHGQNRDLEKYLRFRRNSTRSSSDGSIPVYNESKEEIDKKVGRSLENLATLKSVEFRPPEPIINDENKNAGSDERPNKLVVSTKDSKKEKKLGKNYNFNVESVIEINMPQCLPPETLPKLTTSELKSSPIIIPETQSLSTQTIDEEPILPILKTHKNNKRNETLDNTVDISPDSSVASNRQKLEWDSLGDIGYDPNDKYLIYGADELPDEERNNLRNYFARKGMDFEKLVVVAKNQKTPKKPLSQVSASKSTKEIWKDVFNKYKEKYIDQSINQVVPDAQSTPKPTEKQEIKNVEVNKSTQTSLVRNVSKSIQANNAYCKEGDESREEAMTTTESNIETVGSFEYFSPSIPPPSGSKASSQSTNEKSSISTSKSSGSSGSQKPEFEEEVRLAFALFQAITERYFLFKKIIIYKKNYF